MEQSKTPAQILPFKEVTGHHDTMDSEDLAANIEAHYPGETKAVVTPHSEMQRPENLHPGEGKLNA